MAKGKKGRSGAHPRSDVTVHKEEPKARTEPDDVRFWEDMKDAQGRRKRESGKKWSQRLRDQERWIREWLSVYLEPTPNETDQLEEVERALSDRAGFYLGLEKLLQRWTTLVLESERGFDDCEDEWDNDVSARALLQKIIEAVPGFEAKLMRILEPWDARFKKATVASTVPVGGFIGDDGLLPLDEVAWWWLRRPTSLVPDRATEANQRACFWDDAGRPIPAVAQTLQAQAREFHELSQRFGSRED